MDERSLGEEARQFDPEELLVDELERRRELDHVTSAGAEVVFDLQQRGPLYRYVLSRRVKAKDALKRLIDLDPKDGAGIATAQAEVREYIDACNWIARTFNDAKAADDVIRLEAEGEGDVD
jgi:hypothetical protein